MSMFKKRPTISVGPNLGKKQGSVLGSFVGSKKKKDKVDDFDEYSDNDSYNGEDSPREVEEPSDAMSFLLGKRASVKPTPDRDSGRPPSSNNIPIGNNINNHDNKSSGTDLSCSYDSYVSEESDDDSYDGESNSWTPKKKGETDVMSFLLAGNKNSQRGSRTEQDKSGTSPQRSRETDMLSFLRAGPSGSKEEEEEEEEEEGGGEGKDGLLSFLLAGKRDQTAPPTPVDEESEEEVEEGKGGGDVLSFLLSSAKRTEDTEEPDNAPADDGEFNDVHHDDDDDDFDPDVKYGENAKGKRVIKAATVNRLIDSLLTTADPVHRNSFLMTYRGFLQPETLLDAMEHRYEPESETNAGNNQRRVRIVGVLKAWVEQFFYDFEEEATRKKLEALLKAMEPTMESSVDRLRKVFIKSQKEHEKKTQDQEKLHADTMPGKPKSKAVQDLVTGWKEIDERTIAEQMTLIESKFFNPILPKECLGWNKKNKEKLCPNIWRMIQHFNAISSWVRTQMVREARLKNRIELLKRFIRLMEELKNLNNFNGMMEVLSGLNSAAVRRMKKTFGGIGSDYSKKLQSMEDLLSHQFSFRAYREHLHTISPPCVPYMGVYLTDLTFILDGNPDYIERTLVNYFKFKKVADIVIEIQQYQTEFRSLQTRPHLSNFLLALDWLSEEDCYRYSSRVEAKKVEETVGQLIHAEDKLRNQLDELKEKEYQLLIKLKGLEPVPSRPPLSSSFIPTQCHPGKYYAVWAYNATNPYELTTVGGEILSLTKELNNNWSYFKDTKGKTGLVPMGFVRKFAEGGAINSGASASLSHLSVSRSAAAAGGRPSAIRKHSVQSLRLNALPASTSSPINSARNHPPSPDIQQHSSSSPSPPSRMSLDATPHSSPGPPPRPAKPGKPRKPSKPNISPTNKKTTPPATPPIMTYCESPKRDVSMGLIPPPISPGNSPMSSSPLGTSPPGNAASPKRNLKIKGNQRAMNTPPADQDRRGSKRLGSGLIGSRSRVGSTTDESHGLRCASTTSLSGTAEAWKQEQGGGGGGNKPLPSHGAAFSTSMTTLPITQRSASSPMSSSVNRGGSFDQGGLKLPKPAKNDGDLGGEKEKGTPRLKKRESKKGPGTPSWLLKSPSGRKKEKEKDKE